MIKLSLTYWQMIELVGITATVATSIVTVFIWFVRFYRKQIIAEVKLLLYRLQDRIEANEVEINHLNANAENRWPDFSRLILSVTRRSIDDEFYR